MDSKYQLRLTFSRGRKNCLGSWHFSASALSALGSTEFEKTFPGSNVCTHGYIMILKTPIDLENLTQDPIDMFKMSIETDIQSKGKQTSRNLKFDPSMFLVGMQAGKKWSIHCLLLPLQAPQLSPLVTWRDLWLPGVKKPPKPKGANSPTVSHVLESTWCLKHLHNWHFQKKHVQWISLPFSVIILTVSSCQHVACGKMLIFKAPFLWMQAKMFDFRPRTQCNLPSLEFLLGNQLVGKRMFLHSCPKIYSRDEVEDEVYFPFHGLDRPCVYVRLLGLSFHSGRLRHLRNCLTCDGTAKDGHRWPQNESKGSKHIEQWWFWRSQE